MARSASTTLTFSLTAACLAAGCAGNPAATRDGHSLHGTGWQLVAIQSMDDAQGTTRIAEPARFTLRFGSDGRASLRLDCNRGSGDYTLNPAGDGDSGSLRFGPIAATRALCPPPHLDERVARDLGHVRGYLLKDGKLYLSLMADAAIYEWAPAPQTKEVR
jgi:heat shock protein HslJ